MLFWGTENWRPCRFGRAKVSKNTPQSFVSPRPPFFLEGQDFQVAKGWVELGWTKLVDGDSG
jgi:hypothetical protein